MNRMLALFALLIAAWPVPGGDKASVAPNVLKPDPAATKLLAEAHIAVRELSLPMQVVGAFALRCQEFLIGPTISTIEDLQSELSDQPPSLYAFSAREVPLWDQDATLFRRTIVINPYLLPVEWYHLEYKDDREIESRRSLWIVPSGEMGGEGK